MMNKLAVMAGIGPRIVYMQLRAPLWHPSFPFVILWSHKAGCTTVVKWFFHQLGLLDEAERHSGWIHDYENSVFKAEPGYLEGCRERMLSGIPIVKFVRDPAARAYSGYLELCNPRVREIPMWRNLRKTVLMHVTGSPSADVEQDFSFLDFIGWLEHVNVRRLEGHIRPQHLPYEDRFEIQPLAIESIHDHFVMLEQRHGLKPHAGLERIFDSHHHHVKQEAASGYELEKVLGLAVPVRRHKDFVLPAVSTRLLARTRTGERLAKVFAMDYSAYPQYGSPHLASAGGATRSTNPLRRLAGGLA